VEGEVLTTRYFANGEELFVAKYRLRGRQADAPRDDDEGKPLGTDVYDRK
jgi:hypothetical protein